jgi:membrane protein YqaA with SNARE-associated domain
MESDDKPLAAGRRSLGLWIVLIGASASMVAASGNLKEYAVFAGVAGAMCAVILSYMVGEFHKKVPALLATGQALERYDYSAQTRKGIQIVLGVLVFLVLPLALSGFLDAPSWYGSVIGGIDGWLVSLVAYNAVLRRWQKTHGGKLYQCLVWRGTKVAQKGLKFQKAAVLG